MHECLPIRWRAWRLWRLDGEEALARRALSGAADGRLVAWLYLRCLAGIYLAAFWSLAVQIDALAGSQGVYPLAEQLDWAVGQYGVWRFVAYPSVFWVASGDWALTATAWAGCVLSLLLVAAGWIGCRADGGAGPSRAGSCLSGRAGPRVWRPWRQPW